LPVAFSRLRIAGFKSFAEPATVEILPGMTGIVGPNGCGKSNVVEALRWAMGENSARSLRGGEMDDVIFAGTAARPSRNIAEVMLTLDQAAGFAPPPFNDQPELQIGRRIERGMGSTYRVNGREVRARDVQTLFADLASGARSSAMVSQGRVGTVVNARPEERRAILEEAAGITGLHARRHEAELKLRAAEANLARAEDLRGQLEAQLGGLKRQARQASRYRNISGHIRTAEQELLALQRARAEAARDAAQAALQAATQAVAEATERVKAATTGASEGAAALVPLREAESDSRTALERHRVAQEQIAAEEQRAKAALAAAGSRSQQINRDLAHAEQLDRDAAAAEARLADEEARLAAEAAEEPAKLTAATEAAVLAEEAMRAAEAAANRATEAAAELNASSQALTQLLAQAEQRTRRAAEQLARREEEHAKVSAQRVPQERLAEAEAEHQAAEAALTAARSGLEAAERARAAGQVANTKAREALHEAESARTGLAAETRALSEVLAVKDGERWPPMVDALNVPSGLERALGAALGEELAAAANRDAARHWRELPPLPAASLPEGATALAELVQGPPTLARALAGIGLVDEEAAGDAAQPALAAGQALVSRDGAVWRWDGYTIRAGTPTAAAVRLQQRNRLAGLREKLSAAEAAREAARAAHEEAATAERAAGAAEQQARTARREAEQRLERARAQAASLRARDGEAATRLAALAEQIAGLEPEKREAEAALEEARLRRAALPDLSDTRAAVEQARSALSAARSQDQSARAALSGLQREAGTRADRLRTIVREREDWRMRAADAAGRVTDLTSRRAEAEAEHASLAAAPATIAARRAEALAELQAAEAAHRRAADVLNRAVEAGSAADRAARTAEAGLATAREDAVRAEAVLTQAQHGWGVIAERILERFGAEPGLPALPADCSPEAEEKARKKLERLQKEREEMGPVNLRAEIEAEEVETRIAAIATEREELSSAIAKLRGSIGHLNREGRERLAQVFAQVDQHFQALFTRMFGGGRAHLALVGSDDPLMAGLEIYAQPPGKKLATLSLLSGGEQALTALSLVFAVFRCNPAPVCVLDEVDAPLDDANVERFCLLLDDMVRETGTRFLVVTHHHLTMARMDRLYGVTMQERGISRLLSVDLQQAAGMVEKPRMAAE
jgi:chromosome segregation protein